MAQVCKLWIILARSFAGNTIMSFLLQKTNESLLKSTAERDVPLAVPVLLSNHSRRIGLHTELVTTEFRVQQTCLQIPNYREKTICYLVV